MLTPPRFLMISPEYNLQRVGGLGTHVQGLAPRLSERVLLDLIVPHLCTTCRSYKREGQSVSRSPCHLSYKFNTRDNIPPLIIAPKLNGAVAAPEQMQKVVGLKKHIIKFNKIKPCFEP